MFVINGVSISAGTLKRWTDVSVFGVIYVDQMAENLHAFQKIYSLRGHLVIFELDEGCVRLLVHYFDADDDAVVGEEGEEFVAPHTLRRKSVYDYNHPVILSMKTKTEILLIVKRSCAACVQQRRSTP